MASRRRVRTSARASDPRVPKGVLASVFYDWFEGLPMAVRAASDAVPRAEAAAGVHVLSGSGCDATVASGPRSPSQVSVRDRCGGRTCHAYVYSLLSEKGMSFGVRACRDHVPIVLDEPGWKRVEVSLDTFSVWEVMTT